MGDDSMPTIWNLNIQEEISRIIHFIKIDIWRIQLKKLPRIKSFFIKQARIFLLAFQGFYSNQCPLRASSLTFYSVLSITPVAAMAFGIAKGFGFEKHLQKQFLEKFPGQEAIVTQVINFAHTLLENTKGGMIAGIGLIVLFWVVIKVLGHIERSFNDIWGIKENRSLVRKFSDYISIMLICPLLVILSSSATVFITTQITLITEKISLLGMISPFIFFILKLIPYGLIWVLFTLIYIVMPNTKVNFSAGIVAGIIAGSIYQVAQWAYIIFQVGVAKYNAIYGSFAALPLFLVWLNLSWMIVLFGAEFSFAQQNVDDFEFEPDCLKISFAFKKLLALQISHLVIRNFASGKKPLPATQISLALEIPIRLVRQILHELVESRIFSDTKPGVHHETAYQPARDINILTLKYIIDALENNGTDNIPVSQTRELTTLSETIETFQKTIETSPANMLLKDI